jgi:hypothetical protein
VPLGGEPGRASPSAQAQFVCGTYKGNQNEHGWYRAINQRVQQEVRSGRRIVQGGLDYVYDDVWIIEDDGTLTYSGTNMFDTNFKTFQFAPAGGGVYEITNPAFSFDPDFGTSVATGDDGAVLVALPFAFPYAGASWNNVYVSGNGILSFGAEPNPSGYFDPADFYSSTPKIAGYYFDLNELEGGTIYTKSEATKFTVTWYGVYEYGTGKPNTFQVVLYPSGNFTFTYNTIQSTLSQSPIVVGFHPGGLPPLEEISFSDDMPHTGFPDAAVYEEYFAFGSPLVNEVALFQRFYQQFPDEFFQLVFFTNFHQTMSGFANEFNIKNDVTGIGLNIFDSSSEYGSNGVLESRCNMNRLSVWPQNPAERFTTTGNNFLTIMGQESGHRWGAFTYFDAGNGPSNLILGRSDAHWSYFADLDHSSLEGGNWEATDAFDYECPTRIDYFSEIDEYLFGLRTPEEVSDLFYISSPENNTEQNRSLGTPILGATATGENVTVMVEHIIAANGARTPAEPDENKDLRQAFILLVGAGTVVSQDELDKIAGFRRAWETYFEVSCDGRLTCNTSLTADYPVAAICGQVRDANTNAIIPAFTARSLERGFNQHVPDGGRYTFRYQADASSGPDEDVTIVFEAENYEPDSLSVSLTYGATTCLDVLLVPTFNAVLITHFDAVARGADVEVRWDVWTDEALESYALYRRQSGDVQARVVAGGPFDATRSYIDTDVLPATSYEYELVIQAADGEIVRSPIASVTTPALVTSLTQNYPNPFNPRTTIEYTLAERAPVAIVIYDAEGKRVRRIEQGVRSAGTHRVEWAGQDEAGKLVGSGVYFYRLEGVAGIAPRKMVLLK